MKKNKNRITTVLLALVFLAGLSLLLYPTVSDYWNSFHASRAVAAYAQEVADLNGAEYDRLLEAARDYNARAAQRSNTFALTEAEQEEYQSLLNMDGTGIMGYIEIPNIKLSLPIYHGTEESVLQICRGSPGLERPARGRGGDPLRALRPPGAAQRQALHESGPAPGGGYLHPAGAG